MLHGRLSLRRLLRGISPRDPFHASSVPLILEDLSRFSLRLLDLLGRVDGVPPAGLIAEVLEAPKDHLHPPETDDGGKCEGDRHEDRRHLDH